MISVDVKKSDSLVPSLTKLSTPDKEPKLSFSDLLKGASTDVDEKIIKSGSLVLDLENTNTKPQINSPQNKETSKENLLLLLKGETAQSEESKDFLALNPKISDTLSQKDVKLLIADAKIYLRDKIMQSDGYRTADMKGLPKTLNGLITVAKKLNIDISKISVEDVKPSLSSAVVKSEKEGVKEPLSIFNTSQSSEKAKESKPLESILRLTPEKKSENAEIPKDVRVEKKTENTEIPKDVRVEKKTENAEIPKDVRVEKKSENAEFPKDVRVEKKSENAEIPKDVRVEKKVQSVEIPRDLQIDKNSTKEKINETIKLTNTQNKPEHISQQTVQVKSTKNEEPLAKVKANDTLTSLLRGEKALKESSGLTADFSVATAKVIAPTQTQNLTKEISKGLESLLTNEQSQTSDSTKIEGAGVAKTENLEIKVKESKQMIQYLSSDVKTAIEDYKSPFTRIKVQLNPQQLGEVDVTVVQRGKNLHVNIGSNNAAINTLSMNVNELRVQLNNNGINNATFNFNNTSHNNDSAAGQQQQSNQQEQQRAHKEYDYFEKEEVKEEILSSLEIVVPNYA